jgi:hypothetical protein
MIFEEHPTKETEEAKTVKFFQCEICSKELDSSLVFWCRKNKERFQGKLLCKEHQRRT